MQSHREGGRSSDRTMLGSMGGRTKMSWPTDNARVVDTRWAHTYDGYQRLASDPQALGDLLRPARDAYDRTREVPPWCGVDFLRGWAFYLARTDRFAGVARSAMSGSQCSRRCDSTHPRTARHTTARDRQGASADALQHGTEDAPGRRLLGVQAGALVRAACGACEPVRRLDP